jgi:formylglycine-generating enzyme required for sulfatase activity
MPGFPSGTNDANLKGYIAWWVENAENQTRPVGGKAPNGFGLYDMSGNVSEWVNDLWSDAYYASSPSTNPPGPAKGYFRVFRGGSFDSSVDELRSSSRELYPASNVWIDRGFRVARTP